MWLPMRQRMKAGAGAGTAFVDVQLGRGRRRFASYIIHSAVVVIIVSIAISSTMQQSKEVQFRKGDTASIGPYVFTFNGADVVTEPNREAIIARVSITKNGKPFGEMSPRMNYYAMSREPIGTPEVRTTLTHDIYLSIMNIDPQSQTLGLHLIINPMVGWIWIATGVLAAGGVFALWPARARKLEPLREAVAVPRGETLVES